MYCKLISLANGLEIHQYAVKQSAVCLFVCLSGLASGKPSRDFQHTFRLFSSYPQLRVPRLRKVRLRILPLYQMDRDVARDLVSRGAFLLVLDLPENSTIIISNNALTVGPIFKGIKMVPPGVHFLRVRYLYRIASSVTE